MNIIHIKKNNFLKNKKFNKIHFIGIGGSGMNGIASIFLQLGYKISGSDILKSEITEKLKKLGVVIYLNHAKKNINNVDLIVISSSIPSTNPEIVEGKKKTFRYY